MAKLEFKNLSCLKPVNIFVQHQVQLYSYTSYGGQPSHGWMPLDLTARRRLC